MEKTIDFLKKIKSNNNKEWFEINKEKYLIAKAEFELVVDKLIKETHKFDKQISPELKGKDCTFRIYKDVRFSKDKTPYKSNMGASINPGGKKSLIAGYYLKSASFKKYFNGLDEDGKLKTAPKGFEKDHPLLELLKNKHFIVSHKLSDKQLLDKNFVTTVASGFKAMHPLLNYLREATAK
jgi:uncharacterized protein (DUF2461 family)